MNEWIIVFLLLIVLLTIIGLVGTYRSGIKQTSNESESPGPAVARHKVRNNPIFWTYILFPVVVAVGAVIFYYFIYGG